MFRLREGHTHFCSRTWKEEELSGLRARGGSRSRRSAWLRGPHTHLSLSGDIRKRRGGFTSAPEPAEHEPHRWREKTMRQNGKRLSSNRAPLTSFSRKKKWQRFLKSVSLLL